MRDRVGRCEPHCWHFSTRSAVLGGVSWSRASERARALFSTPLLDCARRESATLARCASVCRHSTDNAIRYDVITDRSGHAERESNRHDLPSRTVVDSRHQSPPFAGSIRCALLRSFSRYRATREKGISCGRLFLSRMDTATDRCSWEIRRDPDPRSPIGLKVLSPDLPFVVARTSKLIERAAVSPT